MRIIFLISFSLFFLSTSFGQALSGKVVNSQNGNPLAFVNILFDQSGRGVSCDIDGLFEIKSLTGVKNLRFKYVGFHDTIIACHSIKGSYLNINMRPKSYQLTEVKIMPGANPAHRIIKACTKNRNVNNPEKLASFSYKAYHKMIFTSKSSAEFQPDSLVKGSNSLSLSSSSNDMETLEEVFVDEPEPKDSTEEWEKNFFKSQHLFIMESVSERKFKRPDKNYEKVIGTRVSGLKDPFFAMIATQMQSFSFYKPTITLIDKNYINPISVGSTKKYLFLIEDTIYQGNDSVYVISYRPYKGKNFDGLRGVIYINTNKYAIQNVIAEPADTNSTFGIRIQQKYELIDNKYWFPVQLNTNLEFNTITLNKETLVGIGKSYLKNIEIEPSMKGVRFSNIILDIDRKAGKQDSIFWNANRVMQLDSLESKTYQVIDSIGDAENLDEKLWVLRTLGNGYIPWGPVNMEIDKFFQYNQFEGFRLGISLKTNERVSQWFQLGAYGAYGFRDYQWKYGGSLDFTLHKPSETHFTFQYQHDVSESAAQESFSKSSFYNTDLYRNFLIKEMNYIDLLNAELRFRALTNFSWKLGYSYFEKTRTLNSDIYPPSQIAKPGPKSYFQETYIETRFAYKEKIVRNPIYQFSLGTKYPILNIRYTYGSYHNAGDIAANPNYSRLDAQISKSFFIRYLGKSSFNLRGGLMNTDKNMPWYQLYNGRGSYAAFYLESPNSFGTMRMNEFLSDQYMSLFYRHDFGSLLFGDGQFVPQPEFITSFTIGSLNTNTNYPNIKYQTLEKGYMESGIMLNSILNSGFTTIGVGFLYRYGPYAFVDEWDNFAFKFSMRFSL
ncbi:MAG: carboxypeptidase-like regulatory domain-containing protein [Bacteroidales bacterium]|nr:carboxypeptidase-like regulatory domain-containing protein [Bacteroidales bacterium]